MAKKVLEFTRVLPSPERPRLESKGGRVIVVADFFNMSGKKPPRKSALQVGALIRVAPTYKTPRYNDDYFDIAGREGVIAIPDGPCPHPEIAQPVLVEIIVRKEQTGTFNGTGNRYWIDRADLTLI